MRRPIITALLTMAIGGSIAVPAAAAYRVPVRGTVSFHFAQSPDPDAGIYGSVEESVSYRFTGVSRKGERPLTQATYSYHHESDGGSAPGAGDCVEHFVEDANAATASAHTQWFLDPVHFGGAIKFFIPSVQVPVNTSTTYTGDCDPSVQNRSGVGYLTLPLVRLTFTQAEIGSTLAEGTVSPDVPLVEDWLDLGSTPVGYEIETQQLRTFHPSPRATSCSSHRLTVVSLNGALGAVSKPGKCWKGLVRLHATATDGSRCVAGTTPASFAFDEMSSSPAAFNQRFSLATNCVQAAYERARCPAMGPCGAVGFAFFGYDTHYSPPFGFTAPVPTGYAVRLLELYDTNAQRAVLPGAERRWMAKSVHTRYGAIVEIAGSDSAPALKTALLRVCKASKVKYIGVYLNRKQAARLTTSRLRVVTRALTACMTK
jgi:hypothetical protein